VCGGGGGDGSWMYLATLAGSTCARLRVVVDGRDSVVELIVVTWERRPRLGLPNDWVHESP
jgi:hypothetical protein